MGAEITIHQPLTIPGFCQKVIAEYREKWPPSEEFLAHDFVFYFQIDQYPALEELETFCRSLGVAVSVQKLPSGLRGHNCVYNGQREIIIGAVEGTAKAIGSCEHTLFHELREMIEYDFRKIGHPIAKTVADLEERAERFASMVRSITMLKFWKPFFADFGKVESFWGKVGTFLFLGVLTILCAYSCLALPHWEDQLPK